MRKLLIILAFSLASVMIGSATLAIWLKINLRPHLSTPERLALFPDELPIGYDHVDIHWNAQQVPFINAHTDRDAAFALGMVHIHLRQFQMEMMRTLAKGELSQWFGPPAIEYDYLIKLLDLNQAQDDILREFPLSTQQWLTHFVAGINFYLQRQKQLPVELRLLNIQPQPWKVSDIVSLARISSPDINWIYQMAFLSHPPTVENDAFWQKYLSIRQHREASHPISQGLFMFAKTGSNAVILGGQKTVSGSPVITSDSHLNLFLPNLWLLVAFRSPSYFVSGLSLPGLPFVGMGRNQHMVWGGTNLRAWSTRLISRSQLPTQNRKIVIRPRWGKDRVFMARDTALGPIITDHAFFKPRKNQEIIFQWEGHQVSDEISAFLNANQSASFETFRHAFKSYAVLGLNLIAGDKEGNIGKIYAARIPALEKSKAVFAPADISNQRLTPLDLPYLENPAAGYIISTNNAPHFSAPILGPFFTHSDRLQRFEVSIENADKITPFQLSTISQDTFSQRACALKQLILSHFGPHLSDSQSLSIDQLSQWSCQFHLNSLGAAQFYFWIFYLGKTLYQDAYDDQVWAFLMRSDAIIDFLKHDIQGLSKNQARKMAQHISPQVIKKCRPFPSWDKIHFLELNHVFSNIPLLGSFFRFYRYPVAGSNEVIAKTAHGFNDADHTVSYGTQARHMADLGDDRENYFSILGGQDGWLGSQTFDDQVAMWRARKWIQIPMDVEALTKNFSTRQSLAPKNNTQSVQ